MNDGHRPASPAFLAPLRSGLLAVLGAACLLAAGTRPALADAASLRAKQVELKEELASNGFGRAMHIDSTEAPGVLQGDVYAVLDYPYATVSQALKEPGNWCDILILPFNTKYCHAVERSGGEPGLQVRIGRKYNQPVEQAFRLDFAYRNLAATPDYFESRLNAPTGPVGTRDYRIAVSAVPADGGKTFMHLRYSYGYGTMGKLAMQTYLQTAGASKIGFSVMGKDANGQPQYVDGVRGAIERNAMRYYLAIDAYLGSLSAGKEQRVERRIQNWFSATERYPRQLREMDRSTYVAMKKEEVERQQTALLQ